MPRQIRIEFPGAIYHVMSRGNRRAEICATGDDLADEVDCSPIAPRDMEERRATAPGLEAEPERRCPPTGNTLMADPFSFLFLFFFSLFEADTVSL